MIGCDKKLIPSIILAQIHMIVYIIITNVGFLQPSLTNINILNKSTTHQQSKFHNKRKLKKGNIYEGYCTCQEFSPGSSSSLSSLLVPALQNRHLQHTIHGAANKSNGDATNSRIPKPANIPITWVLCHITEALECPNLFLHGPLS